MPRVAGRGVLGPLDFDRGEPLATGDDEIHFRARLAALVMQFSAAQVLQAFPQLNAHPLLEQGARIRPDGGSFQRQFRSGIAHADIEKSEPLGGQQALAQTT